MRGSLTRRAGRLPSGRRVRRTVLGAVPHQWADRHRRRVPIERQRTPQPQGPGEVVFEQVSSSSTGRAALRVWRRVAAAMWVSPARRRTLIAVVRRIAMTRCARRSGLRRRRRHSPGAAGSRCPGAPGPRRRSGRGCLDGRHRGDDVDDLRALLARDGTGASDPGDLDRAGEVQHGGGGIPRRFGIHRQTVAARLRRAGAKRRGRTALAPLLGQTRGSGLSGVAGFALCLVAGPVFLRDDEKTVLAESAGLRLDLVPASL